MRLPKLPPVLMYMALAACSPAAVKPPAGRIIDAGQAGSAGGIAGGAGGSGVAGTGGSAIAGTGGTGGTGGSGGSGGAAGAAGADARPMVVNPPPRPPSASLDARSDVGGGGDDDNLLYVTGSGNPFVSDTELIEYLEDRGYDVSTETDTSVTLADTEGKVAILLSASVTAATVIMTLPQLVTMTTPIVAMDENLEPLLNMTAASDEAHNNTPGTQVTIPEDAENDLTGGLDEGTVTVYNSPFEVGWGVPGPGALRGATLVGNNGQLALYAYPAGAMMANNVTAPGKRVFFFFRETNTPTVLNEDGLELFEAAVEFAADD